MNTSTELRAAAERVVAHFTRTGAQNIGADGLALAKDWLAEHPPDDGQPVDATFLESVGFQGGNLGRLYVEYVPLPGGRTRIDWFYERASLPVMATRGDVRRLAAALGVQLKEAP